MDELFYFDEAEFLSDVDKLMHAIEPGELIRSNDQSLTMLSTNQDLTTTSRFASISVLEMDEILNDEIPKSTVSKAKWSYNIFSSWLAEWRVRCDGPLKELTDPRELTIEELDNCLQFFQCVMKKTNGDRYPPQTQNLFTKFYFRRFHMQYFC